MCKAKSKVVSVYLVWVNRRDHFELRWRDAHSGRWRQRSAGRARRRAEQQRAALEAELTAERPPAAGAAAWSDFWATYITCGLAGRSEATVRHAWSARRALGSGPDLDQLTGRWIADRLASLHQRYRPATVASYAKRLRAALRWGHRLGYCEPLPVPVPATEAARCRALTLEEFERIEMAAAQIYRYRPAVAAGLSRLMRAAWCSGLRLGELLALSWDDPAGILVQDLDRPDRLPTLAIPPDRQKNRRSETIPCPPGLGQLLRETPLGDRSGPVLASPALGAKGTIGKKIAACGRRAGVRGGGDRYASAHDLRASFALRWAEAGLAEAELAAILRHKSVETTRRYYVRVDAQRLAARMYQLEKIENGLTNATAHTRAQGYPQAAN